MYSFLRVIQKRTNHLVCVENDIVCGDIFSRVSINYVGLVQNSGGKSRYGKLKSSPVFFAVTWIFYSAKSFCPAVELINEICLLT